jgi:hypothetical protein
MKRHLGGFGLVTLMIVVLAVPAGAQVVFTDVTEEVGIALTDQLIESVAWGDYDDDGDQDLYLTGDGPNHLFRNDGDGRFTDVTAAAGVGHSGFSVGTAFGDLDNDGDLDLYVVNFQDGPDVLYRNDGPTGVNGAYKFTDITVSAGTRLERSSRGMAFVDYDRDGLLDIFVMAIGPNILYHNDGGLRFHDVARELGVESVLSRWISTPTDGPIFSLGTAARTGAIFTSTKGAPSPTSGKRPDSQLVGWAWA